MFSAKGRQLKSFNFATRTRRGSTKTYAVVALSIVLSIWALRTFSSHKTFDYYSSLLDSQLDSAFYKGGVYRYPSLSKNHATTKKPILVYITTHWSNQHRSFIRYCWPQALESLQLFQHADVAVFSTALEPKQLRDMQKHMTAVFQPTTNLTIYQYPTARPSNNGNDKWEFASQEEALKQQGAILALTEAGAKGYFDSYEWVIRVNPDVLIQNDEWLLQTMLNKNNPPNNISSSPPRPDLLYVPCTTAPKIHTDFFALRPSALPPGALAVSKHGNAERSFAHLTKNLVKWKVPDTKPFRPGRCRVGGPIVEHFHFVRFEKGNHTCPVVFHSTRRQDSLL